MGGGGGYGIGMSGPPPMRGGMGGGGIGMGGKGGKGGGGMGMGGKGGKGGGNFKITVTNLDSTVTWKELKDHMRKAGDVRHAGDPRQGVGEVEYTNLPDAENALRIMNNTQLNGRPIFVQRVDGPGGGMGMGAGGGRGLSGGAGKGKGKGAGAGEKRGRAGGEWTGTTPKLYIGNLAYDVTDEILKAYMETKGTLLSCVVLTDPNTKRSKGCGTCEYESLEEAEKAVKELSETKLNGRSIFVREDREPAREAARAARIKAMQDKKDTKAAAKDETDEKKTDEKDDDSRVSESEGWRVDTGKKDGEEGEGEGEGEEEAEGGETDPTMVVVEEAEAEAVVEADTEAEATANDDGAAGEGGPPAEVSMLDGMMDDQ